MADTISVSIIITFAAELLFSLALPILALVIWKKKEGTELRPAWIGAAAYFVFGMVLEQLINERRFVEWDQRILVKRAYFMRDAALMGAVCNAISPVFAGKLLFDT